MTLAVIIALVIGVIATGGFSLLQSIKLKRAKIDQDLLRTELEKTKTAHAKEVERLTTLLKSERERADLNLMWKGSFVDLSNQTRWTRKWNLDHKFGEWDHINICKDADGVPYVATDSELKEMRDRALKHPEDFK